MRFLASISLVLLSWLALAEQPPVQIFLVTDDKERAASMPDAESRAAHERCYRSRACAEHRRACSR